MKFFGMNIRIPEFLREGAIAVFVERTMKLIDSAVEKNGDEVVKQMMVRLTDNHRALFWSAVGKMEDQIASTGIWAHYRRWKAKPDANSEDRFTNILARMHTVLSEDPEELDRFLRDLGHMTAIEFDDAMTALENDVIAQWFKRARQLFGEAFVSARDGIVSAAKTADDFLEPVADALEDFQERQRRKHFR